MNEDEYTSVDNLDNDDAINQGLSLPKNLMSSDGRLFKIIAWAPTLTTEQGITANIEVLVCLPPRDGGEL